jgi:hypothetical protein
LPLPYNNTTTQGLLDFQAKILILSLVDL